MCGFGSGEDFRGHYRSNEAAIFLAYGVTDWLALELEGSQISGTFDKSSADTSGLPARIRATGTADIGGQARLRLRHGRGHGPELFASGEGLPPPHRHQPLSRHP